MYQSLESAKKDGWVLVACAYPTRYNYYVKCGEMKREDELVVVKSNT